MKQKDMIKLTFGLLLLWTIVALSYGGYKFYEWYPRYEYIYETMEINTCTVDELIAHDYINGTFVEVVLDTYEMCQLESKHSGWEDVICDDNVKLNIFGKSAWMESKGVEPGYCIFTIKTRIN